MEGEGEAINLKAYQENRQALALSKRERRWSVRGKER